MPVLPGQLALTSPADGALAIASDIRNANTAIQTEANALLTILAAGTTGQVLTSGGGTTLSWLLAPSAEYAYSEFSAPVSVTATTEGTANTVVTASAVTFDGATIVWIEFFCPYIDAGAAANNISVVLYQDGSSIGKLGISTGNGASEPTVTHSSKRRMTPAAGARTYSIRAFVNAGTGSVGAGVGGSGAYLPGYIRITKS